MKIEFLLHRITFMLLLATQHNIHSTLLISQEDSPFSLPSPGFLPWSSVFLQTNDTFSYLLVISTCFTHYAAYSLLHCCALSSSVSERRTEKWRKGRIFKQTDAWGRRKEVAKTATLFFFCQSQASHRVNPQVDTRIAVSVVGTDSLKDMGQKLMDEWNW